MQKTGWYIDLGIVFTHSCEDEIPNLVFNLVSLEKKFGAIVSWVLNEPSVVNMVGVLGISGALPSAAAAQCVASLPLGL